MNEEEKITRTRFAPSPTGYIHVGNVRSALYPYLVARQAYNRGESNARFILRIEDTDQARYVEDAEQLIIDTLKWLSISWDEGPAADSSFAEISRKDGDLVKIDSKMDEIGKFGPYHQTARREIYWRYAKKLVEKGLAYTDTSNPDEVQAFREACQATKRPFTFREFREQKKSDQDAPTWNPELGLPLRFRSTPKAYAWHDQVYGDLSAGPEAQDDLVLIKSDGLPTYNFAHIVDDYEQHLTHVIRGQEYISSMPKYLALYDALDIKWPIFAHLPHILRPDGKKKLGKRDGAKSVSEYRENGILPEAMLNFLALLGWNPGNGSEQEIFTLDELVEQFDFSHVQKSGARFDENHLVWMNGVWIRKLAEENFAKLAKYAEKFWGKSAQASSPERREQVLRVIVDRIKTLQDLPMLSEYFFAKPTPDWNMIDNNKQLKKMERKDLVKLLKVVRETFAKLSEQDFADSESVQTELNNLLSETGQKPGILFSLIRFALSWAPFSPALPEMIKVLGKNEMISRIDDAINAAL